MIAKYSVLNIKTTMYNIEWESGYIALDERMLIVKNPPHNAWCVCEQKVCSTKMVARLKRDNLIFLANI